MLPGSFSSADQTFSIDKTIKPFYFIPTSFTSLVPACALTSITLIDPLSTALNNYFDTNLLSKADGNYFEVKTDYMHQVNTI